jgi:sensor histidine kinase regulating citrate/malate metabolism
MENLDTFIHDMNNELTILYTSLEKLKMLKKIGDPDIQMVEKVITQMKKTMKDSLNICEETLNPTVIDANINNVTKEIVENKKDSYLTKIKVVSMQQINHKISPILYKNVVHNIIKNASEAHARDLTVYFEDNTVSFIDNGNGLSDTNLKDMISTKMISTKGEDRGIGLKSIAQFCKKFKLKLSFEHNKPRGLVVKLIFPKQKRY